MQENDRLFFRLLRDYDMLERASRKLHPEYSQEMEERLLNIHNHIIWHSYVPGRDNISDAIFHAFVLSAAQESGLHPEEIPVRYQCLIAGCGKEQAEV